MTRARRRYRSRRKSWGAPPVRSKISSDGRMGSRGQARYASASRMRYGQGAVARLRTIASSAIAVASAGASSAKPGLSSSLGVLANITLLLVRPVEAADDIFGRRKRKGGEGASLFSLVVSILSDLVRAAPLWERSLPDRSYDVASVIGMTWTYLRPNLPSRNATWPSVSANKV